MYDFYLVKEPKNCSKFVNFTQSKIPFYIAWFRRYKTSLKNWAEHKFIFLKGHLSLELNQHFARQNIIVEGNFLFTYYTIVACS